MQFEDLSGKTFGRLTVLSLAEPRISPSGAKRTQWLCKCECGRERIVPAARLKKGDVTHCGYCGSVRWRAELERDCRYCAYSTWDSKRKEWGCLKGEEPMKHKHDCPSYWCGEYDKISGANNRKSRCYICGKPVYSHGVDTPIYCEEHRAYQNMDDEAIRNAPYELLFMLVAGIFLRAREDYIFNHDNQRSDAEVFLKGNWAQELSIQGFDAEKLLELLNEEIENATRGTDEDIE